MAEERIFKVSKKTCIFATVGICVGILISALIVGYTRPIIAIGVAVGCYFSFACQKMKVTPEMVSLGKKRQYRFADGVFSQEKLSSLRSWLMFAQGDGTVTIFTPHQGKPQNIYFSLSTEDQKEFDALLRKYSANPELAASLGNEATAAKNAAGTATPEA